MSTAGLPPTAYVPVGSEFKGGRPLGTRVRFDGEGSARRKWWFQVGPVDSCCFCFSLRTGVGLLAAVDLLAALWALIVLYTVKRASIMFESKQDVALLLHDPDCMGNLAAESNYCEERIRSMQDLLAYTAVVLYGAAALFLAAGTTGLWAVSTSNLRPATFYVWAWLSATVFRMLLVFMLGWTSLLILLLNIYHFKVVWSYREALARRGYRASSTVSAQNAGPSFELSSFP